MTPPQGSSHSPPHSETPAKDGAPACDAPPQRERRSPENPERLYILTGEGTDRAPLDLVTLIVAAGEAAPTAQPEHSAILRLCTTPLSVAELSAYMALPFSVVTVVLTELLATELIQARAPVVRSALPDRSLLEAVMHGLQKL
ncbi:DUF742 domain-containing protein [Streptomyces kanamyceticus]|uniref:DUF742 domain-containing protein n=1 Tax=Streptomyces kanamyceticus TaxID=1967 RepID=A0A5J6GJ76_STRKN|nr:DUF742 domain-containing protein [Streptomyces kanamyceticus]QEU95539.1 DUF742 domain-containing protein [Streptomyces kanamyceticus]